MAIPNPNSYKISYVPVPTGTVYHASETENYIPRLNLYDIDDDSITTDLKATFFTDNYNTARLYTTKVGGLFRSDEDWENAYSNYDPETNWPPRRSGSILEIELDWQDIKEIPFFEYTNNDAGIQQIQGHAANVAHREGYPAFYINHYGTLKQEPELIVMDDKKVGINVVSQKRWAKGDRGFETPVLPSNKKMKRSKPKPMIPEYVSKRYKPKRPPIKIPKLPGRR